MGLVDTERMSTVIHRIDAIRNRVLHQRIRTSARRRIVIVDMGVGQWVGEQLWRFHRRHGGTRVSEQPTQNNVVKASPLSKIGKGRTHWIVDRAKKACPHPTASTCSSVPCRRTCDSVTTR